MGSVQFSETRVFAVTTPAGTLKTALHVTALAMPPRLVAGIEVVVPPGPNGVLGFALGAAGTAVMPYNAGGFIITSDDKISWPLTGQIDSGAWQCFSYNLGNFDHTIQIRFLLNQLSSAPAPVGLPVLDAAALTPLSAADLAVISGTDLATARQILGTDTPTAGTDLAAVTP